jgi:hypothetical protein
MANISNDAKKRKIMGIFINLARKILRKIIVEYIIFKNSSNFVGNIKN